MNPDPTDPPIQTLALSPPPVPREVELKLFVPPSSVAGLWAHPLLVTQAIGPLRVSRIDNRYFDTAERDLAQRRMALRLRRVASRWMQTLKVSEVDERAISARGEWEMPVAGPALELARLRGTPLAEIGSLRSLATRLRPVFTTNFRRETRLLRLKDGSEVECAFDVGVIHAGRGVTRQSLPICEFEIEVKHAAIEGQAVDLMKFAARLVREVALIPLAASKAARGFRLADRVVLAPVKVRLPDPQSHDLPRLHLGRVLEACNRALLANAHALLEEPVTADVDIEFIHQARVAVRRMRSALQTFRPVARGPRFDALDDALRTMGHRFGDARDWDVFTTTMFDRIGEVTAADEPDHAVLGALRIAAAERRDQAHLALRTYLDAGAFGATTIAVERLVNRLSRDEGGSATLEKLAPVWLANQCDRVVQRARRIAVLDQEQRHGLRIEVKRLRYALDLLGTLYEAGLAKDFNGALAGLQDKLGKLNDAVVAGQLMQSLPASDAIDLLRTRFDAWLDRHVRKQLPKVAALSVAFELTPQPWQDAQP